MAGLTTTSPPRVGTRIKWIYGALAAGNTLAWAWAWWTFHDHPIMLGTSLLAYTFGLRHAVDADHIAAIDNVTRKLMQDGQRPVSTGLFFALGHSTVVILASAAIVLTTATLDARFAAFKALGGVVSTAVSAAFLFAIAAANIIILAGLYRNFRRVKAGGAYTEEDVELLVASTGLLARWLRPVFKLVRTSWYMYPLGFLFGLGFDTATEIGLLGMSAAGATQGLPLWSIMVFPALFTAGMTLVDTTDSVLMLGAYGWAFARPIRKLYYNMTVTAASVFIALIVGGIEALGIVAGQLGLDSGPWRVVVALNDNLGTVGIAVIGLFAASVAVSILIYRIKGYDRIEMDSAS